MVHLMFDLDTKAFEKEVAFIERMIQKKVEETTFRMLEEVKDIVFAASVDSSETIELIDAPDGLEIRCTRESDLFKDRQAGFFYDGTPEGFVENLPKALEDLE